MNWTQLLSHKRYGEHRISPHDETRSRFEQDHDRIVFSHPFRTLQDKTQVFPLPKDDFVHTRLTHSLEVSSVGRSLGKNAGIFLLNKYPELKNLGYSVHDFGCIVAAAALAHDLGNPPFGHSGEDSISSFFLTHPHGLFFKEKVSNQEWKDLTNFEGNAQGFRILNGKERGLHLTYATLGSFVKYPFSSSYEKEEEKKKTKKYGYSQSEKALFENLAKELGLTQLQQNKWCRHPLVFLVEAADDICYHIIDMEDACRLGLVSFEEFTEQLSAIIGASFSEEKLSKIPSLNEKLGVLRSMTINTLIKECSEVFEENEPLMLEATFDSNIVSLIRSSSILNKIKTLSMDKIYRSKLVLEVEASGICIIEHLIEAFSNAVYKWHFEQKTIPKYNSILHLIPEEHRTKLSSDQSVYEVLQIVIDFISGLTDSHAVRLYQTLKGYRLPPH